MVSFSVQVALLVVGAVVAGCTSAGIDDAPLVEAAAVEERLDEPSQRPTARPVDPLEQTAPDEKPAAPTVEPGPAKLVEIEPGLRVVPGGNVVEFDAIVCLDAGFLEQIVCAPGTREHEALLVTEITASKIHAALLVAGFESGAPGRWYATDDGYGLAAPTGSKVEVEVRYERDGEILVEPVRTWIGNDAAATPLPDTARILGGPLLVEAMQAWHRFPRVPWVFGGSLFVQAPPGYATDEVYAADFSGSIIGLVTFGDELIGLETVIADAADLAPETWVVNVDRIPPMGTRAVVVVRKP